VKQNNRKSPLPSSLPSTNSFRGVSISKLHRAQSFLTRHVCHSSTIKTVTGFHGTQSSLPYSQHMTIGPSPEPDKSNHIFTSHYFKILFILASHLCLGLPNSLLLSSYPANILYVFRIRFKCTSSLPYLILLIPNLRLSLNIAQLL